MAAGPWLLLLVPDGRLPSRRWRPYAVFLLILTGLLLVTAALQPVPTEMADAIVNPLGVALVGDLAGGLSALMLAALPVSATALLMRFRAARVTSASKSRSSSTPGVSSRCWQWRASGVLVLAAPG